MLPVRPPLPPMLARLARELPGDGHMYEPKWDGFRCVAFREGDEVDLRSRNDRQLARYFPEIVEALAALPEPAFALDGELIVVRDGRFDFGALLGRIHPAASRVDHLRAESPARFIAFDLIALGEDDLREMPFVARRTLLRRLLRRVRPPLHLTPLAESAAVAREWLERFQGAGIDGVVAKRRDLLYEPGARAMVKVKSERTADCVVAGFRVLVDRPLPSSLLLGLYDDAGALEHVGIASSFTESLRHELLEVLRPRIVPLEGHPWEHGFLLGGGSVGRLRGSAGRWRPGMTLDWTPVTPDLVAEVRYDQLDERRFRHPARFLRWRPDRDPPSCTFDQLAVAEPPLAELLT